jgi:hypothetical protein
MCKFPSPQHLSLLMRAESLAKTSVERAQMREQLMRANKEAAKNVLLNIQLQLARKNVR